MTTGVVPRVSVVVPVYNTGALLDVALRSIAAQSYRDFETIVVDDGSDDPETLSLLERAERAGTTVHHTPNRGVASARNHAIARARGAFVLPLGRGRRPRSGLISRGPFPSSKRSEIAIVQQLGGAHRAGTTACGRTGDFSVARLLAAARSRHVALPSRGHGPTGGRIRQAFVDGAEDWDLLVDAQRPAGGALR
jgi:hypothetical protein